MSFQLKWFGDDIIKQIRKVTPDALFEAGEQILESAKGRAPFGDGDLQNSGYVANEEKSTYTKKYEHREEVKAPKGGAVVGFAAFYAHMVEYGTKGHKIPRKGTKALHLASGDIVRGPISHPGMKAKPFFRPAVDELQSQLPNKIAKRIKANIK